MDHEPKNQAVIYTAIVPTALMLFGVSTYAHVVCPWYAAMLAELSADTPVLTSLAISGCSNALIAFAPPVVLTVAMLYFARAKPLNHSLCVVVGVLALGLCTGILFFAAIQTALQHALDKI